MTASTHVDVAATNHVRVEREASATAPPEVAPDFAAAVPRVGIDRGHRTTSPHGVEPDVRGPDMPLGVRPVPLGTIVRLEPSVATGRVCHEGQRRGTVPGMPVDERPRIRGERFAQTTPLVVSRCRAHAVEAVHLHAVIERQTIGRERRHRKAPQDMQRARIGYSNAAHVGVTPEGVHEVSFRILVHNRKAKMLARVELKDDGNGAVALQRRFTLKPMGAPTVQPTAPMATIDNKTLIGVELLGQR